MDFPIVPYAGAGEIRFGMSVDEATAILGPPSRSSTAFNGDRNITYDQLFLDVGFAKRDDKLSHLGFSAGASLTLDGLDLFGDPSAFDQLLKRDGEPFTYLGFVILLRLGMMLEGFDATDDRPRIIALFPRGRWDERRAKLRPMRARQS